MAVVIQLRGDVAANWTDLNPVLAEREMALETDTGFFKIGNGADTWADLPYGGIEGQPGTPGAEGPVAGTIDGGDPTSVFGGTTPIDGGTP